MLIRFALFAFAFSVFSAPAYAYWQVQNSEEDVFGNINVTATSIGDNGSTLRFECGSGKTPFVALLIRDNSGDFPAIPASLLMKDAGGTLVRAAAELGPWNEDYVAIKTSDTAFLGTLADAMITTSKGMPIGGEVPDAGIQVSDTFSSQGSTAAGNAVKKGCLSSESMVKAGCTQADAQKRVTDMLTKFQILEATHPEKLEAVRKTVQEVEADVANFANDPGKACHALDEIMKVME